MQLAPCGNSLPVTIVPVMAILRHNPDAMIIIMSVIMIPPSSGPDDDCCRRRSFRKKANKANRAKNRDAREVMFVSGFHILL